MKMCRGIEGILSDIDTQIGQGWHVKRTSKIDAAPLGAPPKKF